MVGAAITAIVLFHDTTDSGMKAAVFFMLFILGGAVCIAAFGLVKYRRMGGTLFMWIVQRGNRADIQVALKELPANAVNERDRYGSTALFACSEAHFPPEIVAELVAAGAEVNVVCADGRTPLHFAAANGRRETVRALLDHGASKSLQDDKGRTPYDWALVNGHQDVAALL